MNNIKRLNSKDYFGMEEKGMFEREHAYLYNGTIPINACIIDSKRDVYFTGKIDGISQHFTFSRKAQVYSYDGTYKLMHLSKVNRITEQEIQQIPKENYVFKVDFNYGNPKKDIFVDYPYKDTEYKECCLGFQYDKTTLLEVIFLPTDFGYKHFGNSGNLIRIEKLYQMFKEAHDSCDDEFDQVLLHGILVKLMKSKKQFGTVQCFGLDEDYYFLKELYINKISSERELFEDIFELNFIQTIYGQDILQELKDKFRNQVSITELKGLIEQLKLSLRFTGEQLPNNIEPVDMKFCYYSDSEIECITNELNDIKSIDSRQDFLTAISKFDKKVVSNFILNKKLMRIVLDKVTFMEKDTLEMFNNLVNNNFLIELTHAIYAESRYNLTKVNDKIYKYDARFIFLNKIVPKDEIINLEVLDYENVKPKSEKKYKQDIILAFDEVKRRKEHSKYSNLELYKIVVQRFNSAFIKIENCKLSFLFQDKLLSRIFDFIKNNKEMTEQILKREYTNNARGRQFFVLQSLETNIINIIETYLKEQALIDLVVNEHN